MSRKPADRQNPYYNFLRRLRAGGRSNMYGAIPYLIAAFGCDRNEAFRIVCEWLDAQSAPDAAIETRERAGTPAASDGGEGVDGSPSRRRKLKRAVQRSGRKPSRPKAA